MTKLSVNINKVATLRNARGGNVPDVLKVALDCERSGQTASRYIRGPTNGIYGGRMYTTCVRCCIRNLTSKVIRLRSSSTWC